MTADRGRRAAATLATASLLLLAACSGPSGLPDTSGAAPAAAPGGGAAAGGAAASAGPATSSAPAASPAAPARKVARTAEIILRVDDPAAAASQVRTLAEGLGGFVASENVVLGQSAGRSAPPSRVVLSVPSAKLDAALDALSKAGSLEGRVVNSADVTAQVVDAESRIKTMRESIARVRLLMNRAGSVGEIAAIESELTRRQAELESLLAQQAALADRVAMSTVTVTLRTDTTIAEPNPVLEGLSGGWAAFLGSVRLVLMLVGGLLPFALAALVLGLPLWWWRRRRPRPAGPAAPGPAHPAARVPSSPPPQVPVVPTAPLDGQGSAADGPASGSTASSGRPAGTDDRGRGPLPSDQ